MNLKTIINKGIKKTPGLKQLNEHHKFNSQFSYDKRFFRKNYSHSKENKEKLGYNMLLISHSLEKGMSNKNPRRFGGKKTTELIKMLSRYSLYSDYENDFAFINAINILRGYASFYEKMGWQESDEYKTVINNLREYKNIKQMDVGSHTIFKKDFIIDATIDYRQFLFSRHSVREFLPKKITDSDMEKAVEIAALSPSACNRQMCKVYYVNDKTKANKLIQLAQGFGGFEKDTINLLVVTFNINANYMIGERNQGWFNAGLFSMNLANALHSIGIGSCFCQFGNTVKEEETVKRILNIPSGERIAVFIAAGYYCDKMAIPYSPRKSLNDIYKKI